MAAHSPPNRVASSQRSDSSGGLDRLIAATATPLTHAVRLVSAPVLAIVLCIAAGWLLWLGAVASETDAVPVIAAALLLGVVEVWILALMRTLSIRTLALLVALGAGPVALASVALTGGLRTLLDFAADRELLKLTDSFSFYLLAPLVEEALKLLPVAAVLLLSLRARSLTVADVLLLGFLVGMGFQFTETVAGRGPEAYAAGLTAVPAGPIAENWQGVFRHGIASGLVAGIAGFWWRSRRRGGRAAPLAWLTWSALAFVLVMHVAVNVSDGIAPIWEPLEEPLHWLARSAVGGGLPLVLFLVVGVCSIVVDLRDLRAVAPLPALLLPVAEADSALRSRGVLAAVTAPRLRRLEAAERIGTPPLEGRAAAHGGRSGGIVMALAVAAGLTTSVSETGTGATAACLACIWEPSAGLPLSLGMTLLVLALLIPGRRTTGPDASRQS